MPKDYFNNSERTEALISVIVPVYNVEKYLNQCIDSVLAQTYTNLEIILVNDGSVDGSPNICDAYAKIDKRIKVVHKKNGGAVSSAKAGLVKAVGDFVYFVDSDDYISFTAIESLYNAQMKGDYDLVVSSFYVDDGKKQVPMDSFKVRHGSYNKSEVENELLPILLCSPKYFSLVIQPSRCAKLYKRSLLEKNIHHYHEDIKSYEDFFITILYLLSAKSVYLLPKTYDYYYRYNPSSVTKSVNQKLLYEASIFMPYTYSMFEELAPKSIDFTEQLDLFLLKLTHMYVRMQSKCILATPKSIVQQGISDIISSQNITKKIKLHSMPIKLHLSCWLIQNKAISALYWLNFAFALLKSIRNKI